jgi:hypothetical protein
MSLKTVVTPTLIKGVTGVTKIEYKKNFFSLSHLVTPLSHVVLILILSKENHSFLS